MPAKPTAVPKMTAADVVTAIRRHYGAERDGLGPEWAALEEFTLQPGGGYRRADLFLIRAWAGRPKGHERHTIEVKVSRSDLRTELAKPAKAWPFEQVSHRFYLATPRGLVKDTDVLPTHWGLYEVGPGGTRKVREATRNDTPDPLPEPAVVEAFRRAARSEARIRAASDDDAPARLVELERQYAAVYPALHRARTAADRAKSETRDLLRTIAEAGGWLCVCGARIKKGRYENRHADGTDCTHGFRGRAEIDYESLAVRLGVADPDQTDTTDAGQP